MNKNIEDKAKVKRNPYFYEIYLSYFMDSILCVLIVLGTTKLFSYLVPERDESPYIGEIKSLDYVKVTILD